MAKPAKAPQAGTTYPIQINVASGYSVPQNQQSYSINMNDIVAFTAIGGDCMVSFQTGQSQAFALGLKIPVGTTIELEACVLNGTVLWTPGPTAAAKESAGRVMGPPYRIKVGSGFGGSHERK